MICCAMNLLDFIKQADPDLLAKQAGTNRAYLSQIAYKHRKPSPKLARAIHKATSGAVPLSELRPDVWGNEEESSSDS